MNLFKKLKKHKTLNRILIFMVFSAMVLNTITLPPSVHAQESMAVGNGDVQVETKSVLKDGVEIIEVDASSINEDATIVSVATPDGEVEGGNATYTADTAGTVDFVVTYTLPKAKVTTETTPETTTTTQSTTESVVETTEATTEAVSTPSNEAAIAEAQAAVDAASAKVVSATEGLTAAQQAQNDAASALEVAKAADVEALATVTTATESLDALKLIETITEEELATAQAAVDSAVAAQVLTAQAVVDAQAAVDQKASEVTVAQTALDTANNELNAANAALEAAKTTTVAETTESTTVATTTADSTTTTTQPTSDETPDVVEYETHTFTLTYEVELVGAITPEIFNMPTDNGEAIAVIVNLGTAEEIKDVKLQGYDIAMSEINGYNAFEVPYEKLNETGQYVVEITFVLDGTEHTAEYTYTLMQTFASPRTVTQGTKENPYVVEVGETITVQGNTASSRWESLNWYTDMQGREGAVSISAYSGKVDTFQVTGTTTGWAIVRAKNWFGVAWETDPIYIKVMNTTGTPASNPDSNDAVDGIPAGTIKVDKTAEWTNESTGAAEITFTMQGAPVTKGSDVVIVLDKSGSMYGNRWTAAKTAVTNLANELLANNNEDNNRVALVLFSDDVKGSVNFTTNPTDFTSSLNNANVNGGTYVDLAMTQAQEYISSLGSNTGRPVHVIVVSDGKPEGTVYFTGADVNGHDEATVLKNGGVTIHSIGISMSESDAATLKAISSTNSYTDVTSGSVEQLTSVFAEIQTLIKQAATNAALTDIISDEFDVTGYEVVSQNAGITGSIDKTTDEADFEIPVISSEKTVVTVQIQAKDINSWTPGVEIPTNESAKINYTDVDGNAASKDIPNAYLSVDGGTITVNYIEVNSAGEYLENGVVTSADINLVTPIATEKVQSGSSNVLPYGNYNVPANLTLVSGYELHSSSTVSPQSVTLASGDANKVIYYLVVKEPTDITVTYYPNYLNIEGGLSTVAEAAKDTTSLTTAAYDTVPTLKGVDTFPVPNVGYEFKRWEIRNQDTNGNEGIYGTSSYHPTGENEATFTTLPSLKNDLELVATWQLINFEIEYDLSGGALASGVTNPTSYTYVGNSIVLENPTKEGHTFTGWTITNQSGETEYDLSKITVENLVSTIGTGTYGDLIATANFVEDDFRRAELYIHKVFGLSDPYQYAGEATPSTLYIPDGGTTGLSIANAVDVNQLGTADTVMTNGKSAWYVKDGSNTANDAVLTALFTSSELPHTIGDYSVALRLQNTTVADAFDAATASLPSETPIIWYTVKEMSATEVHIDGFVENIFTLTYDANGGTLPSGTNPVNLYVGGSNLNLSAEPTREGYVFQGWELDVDSTVYAADAAYTMPTQDVEFTAIWEAEVFTITYENTFGVANSNPTSYTVETADITLSDISRHGYNFEGWTLDEAGTQEVTGVAIATGSTGDRTFYAQWSENPEDYATITFLSGTNGLLNSTQTSVSVRVLKGTAWSEITVPTINPNHGWAVSGTPWSPALPENTATIEANATYTAQYVKDQDDYVTITFESGTNGLLNTDKTSVEVEVLTGTLWSTITVPTISANAGWVVSTAPWSPVLPAGTATIEANATYTAQYEKVLPELPTYTDIRAYNSANQFVTVADIEALLEDKLADSFKDYTSITLDPTSVVRKDVGNVEFSYTVNYPEYYAGTKSVTVTGNSLTITPRELTITADDLTLIGNQTVPTTIGYKHSGLVGTDANMTLESLGINVTVTADLATNATVVSATYEANANENYTLVPVNGKYNVLNPSIVVTGNIVNETYDSTAHTATGYVVTGLDGYTGFAVTADSSNPSQTDVLRDASGNVLSYPNEISNVVVTYDYGNGPVDVSEFLTVTEVDGTLTINPAQAAMTLDGPFSKFAATVDPTFTVTPSGFYNNDEPTYTVAREAGEAVNDVTNPTYDVYFDSKGTLNNYDITWVDSTLTIGVNSDLIVKITANTYSPDYTSYEHTVSGYTVADLPAEYGSLVITATTDEPVLTNVGNVAHNVTGHTVTYNGSDITSSVDFQYVQGSLTVNPINLTITANDLTLIGNQPVPTTIGYKHSGLVGTDANMTLESLGINVTVTADLATNATVVSATYEANANENYTLVPVNGKYNVLNPSIVVTGNIVNETYDSTAHTATGYVVTGLDGYTGFAVTADSSNPSQTDVLRDASGNVLSYPNEISNVVVTYDYGNGPVDVSEFLTVTEVDGTLTINPAQAAMTLDGPFSKFAATVDPTFTVTPSGFYNNDEPTYTVAREAGEAVNDVTNPTYDVYFDSKGTLNNYDITWVDSTLTIEFNEEVVVEITANDYSETYTGLEQTVAGYTVDANTAAIANLTVSATTDEPVLTNAGNIAHNVTGHTVTFNGFDITNSVDFRYVSGTLTINKAEVVVNANSHSVTVGNGVPALSYRVSGLVNGETESVLGLPASVFTTNYTGSAPGVYDIVALAGLPQESTNYVITYVGNIIFSEAGATTTIPAAITTTTTPATPTTTTPGDATTDTTTQITDDSTPEQGGTTEVIITEDTTPEAGGGNAWALINLIASIIGMLTAIFLVVSKSNKEEENEETEDEEVMKRRKTWKIVSVVTAIVSIIVFILTEDMTAPMRLVDQWTILMIVFTAINIVSLVYGRKWHENEEEEAAQ